MHAHQTDRETDRTRAHRGCEGGGKPLARAFMFRYGLCVLLLALFLVYFFIKMFLRFGVARLVKGAVTPTYATSWQLSTSAHICW